VLDMRPRMVVSRANIRLHIMSVFKWRLVMLLEVCRMLSSVGRRWRGPKLAASQGRERGGTESARAEPSDKPACPGGW
jgi:hypothetical protein